MKSKNYLGSVLCEREPQNGLYERVLSRIAQARCRAARTRLALQTVICFASGMALVPLAQYAGQELFNSGFYVYASMFFSDRALVLSSWQEFVYSLIESLPSFILLLMLGCIVALVWSLRLAVRNSRIAFTAQQV